MGMFDTILIRGKCPNCGEVKERGYQTKDLECMLDTYTEGDSVKNVIDNKDNRFIEAIASCHNEDCSFLGNISDILWQGTPSGFDFLWDCKIKLDDDYRITNEIYDVEISTKIPSDWESIIEYRYGDYWKFLVEKYKDKKEAADKFGYGKNRRRFITMARKMDYSRLLYREANRLLMNEEYRKEKMNRCQSGYCEC